MANRSLLSFLGLSFSLLLACEVGLAQDDLDSLDAWVRDMHPDPFIRCGEQAWLEALDETR